MLGSTLAGLAFSNASVALVHGMGRPIGANYHVPHGLSNAMLLPYSDQVFYSVVLLIRYSDVLLEVMGIANLLMMMIKMLLMKKLVDELYNLNIDLDSSFAFRIRYRIKMTLLVN